jgi:5-methylcytosine-specific restriction endonuclease McrA
MRAQNRCEICGSGYALEVDHIYPKALGGEDLPENLRLLCKSCNQRKAIQNLGIKKMDQHLN